jgi:hypothetical protein
MYLKFGCSQIRGDISYTCIASTNGPLIEQLQIEYKDGASQIPLRFTYNRYNSRPINKISVSKQYFGLVSSQELSSTTKDIFIYKLQLTKEEPTLQTIYAGLAVSSSFVESAQKFYFDFSPLIVDKEADSQFILFNNTLREIHAYKLNDFNLKMLTGTHTELKDTDEIFMSNEQANARFKLSSIFKVPPPPPNSNSTNNSTTNTAMSSWLKISLIIVGSLLLIALVILVVYRIKRQSLLEKQRLTDEKFIHRFEDYQTGKKDLAYDF